MCNTYIVNEHVSYLKVSSVCGARLGADSAVFETCCQYEPRNETSHFGFKLEKWILLKDCVQSERGESLAVQGLSAVGDLTPGS